eukprot:GFUD01048788.1.p1 GENE.GFUD01048788.1~~GFUD01048788.1.p1  ORF type:complete len:242 (-),score=69.95 GFUD01048788.1:186-911(-)
MLPIPAPRACHIVKRDKFEGYGFNLYKKKNTPGQFIGSIDQGSPAEDAGLKEGDKLVEVNGVNVEQENHKQVVQKIKEIPDEVTILVVDKDCEKYHNEKKIKITNILPHILQISSQKEVKTLHTRKSNDEAHDETLQGLGIRNEDSENIGEYDNTEVHEENGKFERTESISSLSSSEKTDKSLSTDSVRSTPSPTTERADFLNLPMTAKEMRQRIEQMKKKDPRKEENGDWWKKHMIVQAL